MQTAASVLFDDLTLDNGRVLGHAQLNVEATLNSLSLEMIRLLDPALRAWAQRPDVAGVVITGSGDRAFCAGGDIQALYHAIGENHAAGHVVNDYPFRFFEEEYRLDYLIHTFPKPVITLGHGIVMGGGLGIFGASRFRVLTEKSRLAVPEITIGLFPDAGASWTLRNMPLHYALWLGLTGSHVNAADALRTNMGDYAIAHDARQPWMDDLRKLDLTGDAQKDNDLIRAWLSALDDPELPSSELDPINEHPGELGDLASEVARLQAFSGASTWIDKGLGNLANGCPTTAGIVLEQLRRVPTMQLADCFRMELVIASHCATNTDFREGVRALLIDKDNTPQWAFGSIEDLPWPHVLSHFEPPWDQNPLADLEESA